MSKDRAVKDALVPEENRKFSRKKSDSKKDRKLEREKDRKPDGEMPGKKTSSFIPKKVETGTEVKYGATPVRKPEKSESIVASAGKGRKTEKKPRLKPEKGKKSRKETFLRLSLYQSFSQ